MDVDALVTAGATTVVGLMATDGWNRVSGRLARLLGRADSGVDEETAAVELRSLRAELLMARADADETAEARFEEGWRERLREVLQRDAAAVRELAALLDEENPGWRGGTVINNTINGGNHSGMVFMAGKITNNHYQPPNPAS